MKQELTKFQLAAIGAVALAYNELDVTVDALLFVVAGSANYGRESISDTNTKIATIAKGLAHLDLEPDDKKQINEALGVFREFTIYRDVVNHVRIMNLTGMVELSPKSRKTKSVAPFSDKALNIFYDHLIALEKELSSAAMLIKGISTLKSLASNDPSKGLYEEGKRVCSFQFRGYGTRRQTLPPLPRFPSESELRELKMRWQEAQQAEIMAWLSVWVGPRSSPGSGEA